MPSPRAPANHSWGRAPVDAARALHADAPHGDRLFTVQFDFVDHVLAIVPSDGLAARCRSPRTVADFHRDVMTMLNDGCP